MSVNDALDKYRLKTEGGLLPDHTIFIKQFLFCDSMAKDRITLPMSQGGLQRFFSEYKSKLQFSPDKVLLVGALIAIAVFLLHLINPLGF